MKILLALCLAASGCAGWDRPATPEEIRYYSAQIGASFAPTNKPIYCTSQVNGYTIYTSCN
jgi:hypothetical protein